MTTFTPRIVTLSEFRKILCPRLKARWDAHGRRWAKSNFTVSQWWGEAYLRRIRWMRELLILPEGDEPPRLTPLGKVRDLLQWACTTPHNDDGHGHEN